MNRGDAQIVALNIVINDEPIRADYANEIEVVFNPELYGHCVRKQLSNGSIWWDESLQQYCLQLTQEDTFTMKPGKNSWQLRILIDDVVVSTNIGSIVLGDVNSKRILTG